MSRARELLRRFISLRNIAPVVIIVGAVLGTLSTAPLGLSRDQLILALLAFLAIDALVERLELLTDIQQDLGGLKQSVQSQAHSRDFLRYRKDFPRLEHIVSDAKGEIWISGLILDTMVAFASVFRSRLAQGVKLRFLAMDPDGDAIRDASKYFNYRREELAGRVRSNLEFLSKRLGQAETSQAEIRVIDHRLPLGYFIIDPTDTKGHMSVMFYLFGVQSTDECPMLFLHKETEPEWYDRYLKDYQALWKEAKEWKPGFSDLGKTTANEIEAN